MELFNAWSSVEMVAMHILKKNNDLCRGWLATHLSDGGIVDHFAKFLSSVILRIQGPTPGECRGSDERCSCLQLLASCMPAIRGRILTPSGAVTRVAVEEAARSASVVPAGFYVGRNVCAARKARISAVRRSWFQSLLL